MKSRTKARGIALQVLYEIDLTGHEPGQALMERLTEDPLGDGLAEFSRQIVFGVMPLTQKLDDFIAQHAPEWPLDQVAAIDGDSLPDAADSGGDGIGGAGEDAVDGLLGQEAADEAGAH